MISHDKETLFQPKNRRGERCRVDLIFLIALIGNKELVGSLESPIRGTKGVEGAGKG